MASKLTILDDLCPFCGSECMLERSSISMASHIFCTNHKECGADFWFYTVENDPVEMMKRFRRRCVQ